LAGSDRKSMNNLEITSLIFAFVLTYFGVEIFRRWCLKREVVDIPNERSSHSNPTPRGGGLIIVVISLAFYITYTSINGSIKWAYILGAIAISAISWFDDLFSIKSSWRFMVHAFAAVVAIIGIGTLNLETFGISGSHWISYIVTFFWIVWLTNAYNFMDGIDGIAASQAITASIGWAIFGYISGTHEITYFATIISATNLGFIIHNWSPAKIFMGDVGSAFLGFTFAVIFFDKLDLSKNAFIFAIVTVPIFLADSIFTFLWRVGKGERFWEAHRSHIYQRLVLRGHSHQYVVLTYGIISICILLGYFLFWNFL
jgi:Fuc2NAc and GlcNAc transferase